MARTGPAMMRRKDRYQPRAASASQPKTLKTYACARSRPPGEGSDEIRNRAQHQDCQSTWLGSTAKCVCPCRRGDRMKLLLHLLTSLHGTSQTSQNGRLESAKWAKADIDQVDVRDFFPSGRHHPRHRPSTIANLSGTAREKSRPTLFGFLYQKNYAFCGNCLHFAIWLDPTFAPIERLF